MEQSFTVQGELTDLNEFIKATNSHYLMGNKIKQQETRNVALSAQFAKLVPVKEYPIAIRFIWYSKNLRKDIDNVAFAKKFILDGMVQAGVIENDGRKQVAGFSDTFYIDKKNPRVEVIIKKA